MGVTQLPERRYAYKGGLTDTDRWNRFTHRPDDVFVCTLGKSGTTWMQAICALLIFQKPDLDFNPGVRSIWLDAIFEPIEDIVARYEAQTERRVIKTHTPLDGIPFFPECTYLTVYRDPRDAFFSMQNHLDNMKIDISPGRDPDPEVAFRKFLTNPFAPGDATAWSIEVSTHHLLSFYAYRHLPNIHIFHYADLKRDLPAGMRQVADAMGIAVASDTLEALARAASFENMKENADRFAPGLNRDPWKNNSRFFHKGSHQQWQGVLSRETLALCDKRLDTLLGPALAIWLKEGGPLPA